VDQIHTLRRSRKGNVSVMINVDYCAEEWSCWTLCLSVQRLGLLLGYWRMIVFETFWSFDLHKASTFQFFYTLLRTSKLNIIMHTHRQHIGSLTTNTRCAKNEPTCFLSELRQISTKFDNFGKQIAKTIKYVHLLFTSSSLCQCTTV